MVRVLIIEDHEEEAQHVKEAIVRLYDSSTLSYEITIITENFNEEKLSGYDLYFLDSKTTPKSVGEKTAKKYGVDYAHRHVFLDNNNDKKYILKQLAQTERIAKKNGYAVAIGHPKSKTYEALKEWVKTLPEKGIKLVHMSEIVKVLN